MQAFRIPVNMRVVCEWLIKPVVMKARVRVRGECRLAGVLFVARQTDNRGNPVANT